MMEGHTGRKGCCCLVALGIAGDTERYEENVNERPVTTEGDHGVKLDEAENLRGQQRARVGLELLGANLRRALRYQVLSCLVGMDKLLV